MEPNDYQLCRREGAPMPLLSNDDLAAIRARCEAATEGPWEASLLYDVTDQTYVEGPEFGHCGNVDLAALPAFSSDWQRQIHADAVFMAAARSDIPALIAGAEEARRIIDALTARVAALEGALADQEACYEHYDGCEACDEGEVCADGAELIAKAAVSRRVALAGTRDAGQDAEGGGDGNA